MDKRYQVFVSSTYADLQEERQEVMHALLELECIPSGMELFPAANEDQWSVIKKVIDECDYYVVIIAGRYGSCDESGMGYTEKEYRHALSIGKPIIAFLHKDPGTIPANKSEQSDDARSRLQTFRLLAERKLCKYWSDSKDLGSAVSRSMNRLMKSTPATGWVRADALPTQDVTLELLRLRQQVDDLRAQLEHARTTAPSGSECLAQGKDKIDVEYSFRARRSPQTPHRHFTGSCSLTWNSLVGCLAPSMLGEAPESVLRAALIDSVIREDAVILRNRGLEDFQDFYIDDKSFNTIKVQLRALGLITKGTRARSQTDQDTYWTLTPYGDQIMTQLLAIRRPPSATADAPTQS